MIKTIEEGLERYKRRVKKFKELEYEHLRNGMAAECRLSWLSGLRAMEEVLALSEEEKNAIEKEILEQKSSES